MSEPNTALEQVSTVTQFPSPGVKRFPRAAESEFGGNDIRVTGDMCVRRRVAARAVPSLPRESA